MWTASSTAHWNKKNPRKTQNTHQIGFLKNRVFLTLTDRHKKADPWPSKPSEPLTFGHNRTKKQLPTLHQDYKCYWYLPDKLTVSASSSIFDRKNSQLTWTSCKYKPNTTIFILFILQWWKILVVLSVFFRAVTLSIFRISESWPSDVECALEAG